VLEEGRLTDAQGRVVDFKNTVIIMTTNLGSRDVSKGQTLGFAPENDTEGAYERMKAKVQQELKQHFRPEFLNRIDDVIVFHQLTETEIIEIVDLMISSLEKRLEEQDMAIELTPAAKVLLAHRGYDSSLGARPLRRTIQRDIEDPLAEKMLFGDLAKGSIVLVDVSTDDDSDEPFTFVATPKAELPDVPLIEAADAGDGEAVAG
jgi:ATP-dependent Clp protease ATP-binding subunit ClpC